MLSRVAYNAYWMSRYMERAENIARFIEVNLHLELDLPVEEANQWMPLVNVTGDRALFREKYGDPTRDNVIEFLTFDDEYANSILTCSGWRVRTRGPFAKSSRRSCGNKPTKCTWLFIRRTRGAAHTRSERVLYPD
jgi:uncharacterized alpha-E superfamily protein